ncbi:unnamed protein product [Periconia digitata]|uniref:Uncharacterized protein n=1 Tax=Periconia digitata TaxID=1303443 RepID=A0A9W4XSN3_9PLEO|nr:unnamed protein product [Periconia digitata]
MTHPHPPPCPPQTRRHTIFTIPVAHPFGSSPPVRRLREMRPTLITSSPLLTYLCILLQWRQERGQGRKVIL